MENETTYTVMDSGSKDEGLTYEQAAERIEEWYHDLAEWATGDATDDEHAIVRGAIASIPSPVPDGDISDLDDYANSIRAAIAAAWGADDWHGHGSYSVSAADQIGLNLSVEEEQSSVQEGSGLRGDLYDYDTGSYIRAATPEECEASADEIDGVFLLDADGDILRADDAGADDARRVYVEFEA